MFDLCGTSEILRELRYGKFSIQETPFQCRSFVSPPCGSVGPTFMATLNIPRLNIGLPIWLFSNPIIPIALFVSDHGPSPHEHQPHVNPSPSSSNVELYSLSFLFTC